MVSAVPPNARVPPGSRCHILGIMQNRPSHAYTMALDGILHAGRPSDDDPFTDPAAAGAADPPPSPFDRPTAPPGEPAR
jgi:hypothetical protein